MRLHKTIMMVGIACVGLLAWGGMLAPVAPAAVIFHDGFEGVAAGSPPDATIWNQELYLDQGSLVIDDASPGPAGGDQYLRMSRMGTLKGAQAGSFDSQESGTMHFETMVYVDSTELADSSLSILLGKYTAGVSNCVWPLARIALINAGETWFPGTSATDIMVYDSGWKNSGMDLPSLDAWHKLEIDMTFDAVNGDSYVLTVDGASSAPLTKFKTLTGPIDAVALKCGMDETWVYYDDVTVTGQLAYKWPGDADGDGVVNEVDAAALAANWLATEATWSMGDFTGEGTVDDADATIMAANWGHGAETAVPEPSTAVMLIVAAIMAIVGLARRCIR